MTNSEDTQNTPENAKKDGILVKTKAGHYVPIHPVDILYIEADRDYTIISTTKENYFKTIRIGELHEKLDSNLFLRVHQSYVINKNKIEAIHGNHVLVSGIEIPISRTYKDAFLSHYQRI